MSLGPGQEQINMAFRRLVQFLPFAESTTAVQALSYLLGISLFSISFLVFLNSSISFVITDLIGINHGVGNIVGTLGFVDEIVVLVLAPVWGLLSDRLGVRNVAVLGYAIIGLALFLFVQARNVYPQLLLARLFFAVGATAAATMVTAILPSLADESPALAADFMKPIHNNRHSIATLDSQATITQERYLESVSATAHADNTLRTRHAEPSALAGYVGLFTGCGALVALSLFLPLPARFQEYVAKGEAVRYSYYVVGAVAFLVAVFVFFGLRDLKGEEDKGWCIMTNLKWANTDSSVSGCVADPKQKTIPYWHLLKDSTRLTLTDPQIALGCLGGFVARASTVAISLFIPLFINTFFIRQGFCQGSPDDSSRYLKSECKEAYILASIISGVAQLMGLICAPLFGYLSSRVGAVNFPIVVATSFGIAGYVMLPQLPSPEYKDKDGRGGSPMVFLLAALVGISQIGAIVCSLGSLGRGVLKTDIVTLITAVDGDREARVEYASINRPDDTAPLLEDAAATPEDTVSRVRLKGTVAGVYSWCGGAAILLLTKLGGYLFDAWAVGAPFYLMAGFNAVLLFASLSIDVGRAWKRRERRRMQL